MKPVSPLVMLAIGIIGGAALQHLANKNQKNTARHPIAFEDCYTQQATMSNMHCKSRQPTMSKSAGRSNMHRKDAQQPTMSDSATMASNEDRKKKNAKRAPANQTIGTILKSIGYRIQEVHGDGNCFYYSFLFAYSMLDEEYKFDDILLPTNKEAALIIVDSIKSHIHNSLKISGNADSDLLTRLKTDFKEAEIDEIQSVVKWYAVNIILLCEFPKAPRVLYFPHGGEAVQDCFFKDCDIVDFTQQHLQEKNTVVLHFVPGHYRACIPANKTSEYRVYPTERV